MRQNSATGELLTPERLAILALGILELSEKLRSGELDPVEVMEAYLVSFIPPLPNFSYLNVDIVAVF